MPISRTGKYYTRSNTWILDRKKLAHRLKDSIDYSPKDLAFLKDATPEEVSFFCQFLDAHYTGAKNQLSSTWTKQEFSDAYTRNNKRNADYFLDKSQYRTSPSIELESPLPPDEALIALEDYILEAVEAHSLKLKPNKTSITMGQTILSSIKENDDDNN